MPVSLCHDNWHKVDVSVLEGVFARGDRKVGKAILEVYHKCCLFDSWSEYSHNDLWMESFDACGLDIGFYTTSERRMTRSSPRISSTAA